MQTCPNCGAKVDGPMSRGGWHFKCGTFRTVTGQMQDTASCRSLAQDARIASLEAEVERLKKVAKHARLVAEKFAEGEKINATAPAGAWYEYYY